jgi:hypothetical protein
VGQVLTELPVTLDETYERILQDIPKAGHTHRLLQCLAVAVCPLRVQELAEILAIDFGADKGIPEANICGGRIKNSRVDRMLKSDRRR